MAHIKYKMNMTHRFYLPWELMREPARCYNKVWGLFKIPYFHKQSKMLKQIYKQAWKEQPT